MLRILDEILPFGGVFVALPFQRRISVELDIMFDGRIYSHVFMTGGQATVIICLAS